MTGVWPPPVIYGELLPLFDSNRGADSSPRDTYGLGGPPALREPCRPKAAGGLELVGLAQGKVILAGSTLGERLAELAERERPRGKNPRARAARLGQDPEQLELPLRHWGSARVGRRGLRRRSRLGVAESTRGSAIALDPAAPRSCYVALS